MKFEELIVPMIGLAVIQIQLMFIGFKVNKSIKDLNNFGDLIDTKTAQARKKHLTKVA